MRLAPFVLSLLPAVVSAEVNVVKPLALYGLSGGADYWSTQEAIKRGGVERNVMGPKVGPIFTVAAFTAVDVILQKHGKRTEVRVLRAIGFAFMVGCAVNNLQKGRR